MESERSAPAASAAAPTVTASQAEHARQQSRWRPLKLGCSLLALLVLGFFGIFPVFLVPEGGRWLVFVAATLPALLYVALIIMLDRNEIEPWRAMLGAFLWGALVATLIAGIVNGVVGAVLQSAVGAGIGRYLTGAVVAPLSEETAKGIALLILFFRPRSELDNILDGIVYGALVGIGFAMVENYQYFGEAYEEGGPSALGTTFYIRVVVDGWAHAAYTATTGAALGFARETRYTLLKWVVPIGGWIAAVFQHATWNGFGALVLGVAMNAAGGGEELAGGAAYVVAPIVNLFFLGPGLLVLLVMVWLAWQREARIIESYLRDEVEAGTLTPEEYARLTDPGRRRREEWSMLTRNGRRAWNALVNLHQAATDLAFRKWHLSRGQPPKRHQKDADEDGLRREIAAHRAQLASIVDPLGIGSGYGRSGE